MTAVRWAILASAFGLFSLVNASPAAAACGDSSPTVVTDRAEYRQSNAVLIAGCGFGPGEPLSIVIAGPDGRVRSFDGRGQRGAYEWTADENGAFELSYELPVVKKSGGKPGDYGRYVVGVMTSSGALLTSTAFSRLSPASATCGSDSSCWGNSTGDPDFFWLPPTVPSAAPFTGPFDSTRLDDLTVEVCQLDDSGNACVDGPPVERFTAFSSPAPTRIGVDATHEFYTVNWLTGRSGVDRDAFYRVRVLRDGEEIGTIDVDLVQNKPSLALVDPAELIGVVRGQQLTLRFRVQQPTARTRVVINEVESNTGVPGDWIELYNSASVPVSLGGYIVKDNDDAHVYTLPDGVSIPARGYYVVEEAALGFGLGSADSARLFTPDGATMFDGYAWTAHAVTTYGRCLDGVGDFQTTTSVTKGTANDCSIVIRINEIESNGGSPGDWVELFNPGPGPANLKGFQIRDSEDAHSYVLPGIVVPAGGYLVVEEANLGFDLGAPDAVRLFRPDSSIADWFAWSTHALTTYGRCPNGSGALTLTLGSTKGSANSCFVPVTTLHINEVESNGGVPGDWVELINTGGAALDLSGWRMLDNDDTHVPYTLPAGSTIPAGGYFVLEEAAFGFGLGAADSVRLFDPLGAPYESYSWTAHAAITYGRCPNGTGPLISTFGSSKGAANICGAPVTTLHINEVESNGGVPGDWFELINTGVFPVDISGWRMLDNDDTHVPYVFPAGTTVAAGGYLVVEEASFVFGLGAADSVRLFDATGASYESYSWTAHAAVTYGRCPNGTGPLVSTTNSTKGTANDCGNPIKINEIESNGGVPGDWVELFNPTTTPIDISGLIFRDNDDTHRYVVPSGTVVAANGYYLLEEAAFGFGLGAADSARLFDAADAPLDSYVWTAHATTTYGRCPNGTGAFATTNASTKGTVNSCPGDAAPWPGDASVQTADGTSVFGGNLSGLIYEGSGSSDPGVLWAVRNGPGSLFRLVWNGSIWAPDATSGWNAGKTLLYADGTGSPDAEGVTFGDGGPLGGIFVSTERDNNASAISRNSILRFDIGGTGTSLRATQEWNLTADLPVVGANLGMEGITWVPDTFLVSQGFFDESKARAYNPGDYPLHGTGLFFVGVEANGSIYAYALGDGGSFTRVATITTGLTGVMDLFFDRETRDFWAICDDTCNGRSAVLGIDPVTHRFGVTRTFDRPASMPNLNNEGFAIAPLAECVADKRPVYWTDDSETDGHAIRRGTVSCASVR